MSLPLPQEFREILKKIEDNKVHNKLVILKRMVGSIKFTMHKGESKTTAIITAAEVLNAGGWKNSDLVDYLVELGYGDSGKFHGYKFVFTSKKQHDQAIIMDLSWSLVD